MREFVPPKLEREAGGDLIIRKDQPSRMDWSRAVQVAFWPGIIAMLLLVLVWESNTSPKAVFRPTHTQTGMGVVAIVLILAFTPRMVRRSYDRSVLGHWRIGGDRIEFVGTDGDHRSLTPAEIIRVGWFPEGVHLIGPDFRIVLRPEGIPPAEWQQVRDRVQEILSSRFDLAVEPQIGSKEFKASRVLAVALPACSLTVILLWGPTQLPEPWSRIGLGVGVLLFGGLGLFGFAWMLRDSDRRFWRTPRDARANPDRSLPRWTS